MDFIKRQPAFLYLDKNGFYFYESGLTLVVSLAFLATSVKDMDVINSVSLFNQINGFVEQYQLAPASILIILSPNITFEKDFTDMSKETMKEEIEKFIDTVPFESVLAKEYPNEKGAKVIAGNDDLYREIKIGFEKVSFFVENVVPYQMLGQDQAFISNMTTENANQLLKRLDHLKQFSMVPIKKENVVINQNPNGKKEEIQKKTNVRLFAMIGIFAVLFIILGIMLLRLR